MKNKKPVTTTIHHTNETPATAPARHAAFQAIADMSARALALHHFQAALELISPLEHEIRDYGRDGDDELGSEFMEGEVAKISRNLARARLCLGHLEAIANESAANARKAQPAPKAD